MSLSLQRGVNICYCKKGLLFVITKGVLHLPLQKRLLTSNIAEGAYILPWKMWLRLIPLWLGIEPGTFSIDSPRNTKSDILTTGPSHYSYKWICHLNFMDLMCILCLPIPMVIGVSKTLWDRTWNLSHHSWSILNLIQWNELILHRFDVISESLLSCRLIW